MARFCCVNWDRVVVSSAEWRLSIISLVMVWRFVSLDCCMIWDGVSVSVVVLVGRGDDTMGLEVVPGTRN